MTTRERLTAAAAALLDKGGQDAVTLRAVAAAIDVSHNAPYKHFASRDDLLASVAAADFTTLTRQWQDIASGPAGPRDQLLAALERVVAFSEEHRARYRLLFGPPDIAAKSNALSEMAETALHAFSSIVETCQQHGVLPSPPSHNLGITLFAAAHGLIDAAASGHLLPRTEWPDTRAGLQFLVDLFASARPSYTTELHRLESS